MTTRLSIRWKLTVWYGGVLAFVLVVFGAVVLIMLRGQLLEAVDEGLAEEMDDVLSELKPAGSAPDLKNRLVYRFAAHEGFDYQVTTPDGERFFYSPSLTDFAWPVPKRDSPSPEFHSVTVKARGTVRIVHFGFVGPDGPLTIQVGRSLAEVDRELIEMAMTFLFAGPITLLATIGGGYFLAGRVLQPVKAMASAARHISADRLHERIAVVNPHDELGELAETLNQMIERLERSFEETQRFTADAAHELRTPLAIIRNEVEVALRLPRSREDYCRVLENLLEDTNRLSALADQLLFLSRHETGLSPTVRENVAVDELLREVVDNMQPVAKEKGVTLQLAENRPSQLHSDQRLLRRVFINLLDNAIKYTGNAGRICVTSQVSMEAVTIRVQDNGIGIPPEHLSRIFDRFYRVDAARSGEANGAGLGLSICRTIVRSMHGTIGMESQVGIGSTVTVTLPVRESANGGAC